MKGLVYSLCGTCFIIVGFLIGGLDGLDDCGDQHVFTAPTGTIKSHAGIDFGHKYGKSMYCTWHIEAPVGYHVELVAESFELEGSGSSCRYDYLTLYDGPYTNVKFLGKFCGSSFLPVSSTQRYLTLEFRTDGSGQKQGFKLHYNFTQQVIHACQVGYWRCVNNYRCVQNSYRCDYDDDCGDDSDEHGCPPFTCSGNQYPCHRTRRCISSSYLCDGNNDCAQGDDENRATCKQWTTGAWKCGQLDFYGTSGSIQSPGYPVSYYPVSMSCKFHIHASNTTDNITITFQSNFNIETDVGCAYDYLKVYEVGGGQQHGPFCGTKVPPIITIDSDDVIVEFNSDNSDSYTGFKLNWVAS